MSGVEDEHIAYSFTRYGIVLVTTVSGGGGEETLASLCYPVNLTDIYETSALTHSVTNFCLLRMSTKSAILNCYCSERT